MPILSMFYGISVFMFDEKGEKHHRPHIHIRYGGEKCVVVIPDGEIIEGVLRSNKLKLVQAWIEIHKEELMENWQIMLEGQEPFKIEPLK